MIGKLPEITQRDLFRSMLKDFIDPSHELVLLADKIDWQYFENEFKQYFCENNGSSSVPTQENNTTFPTDAKLYKKVIDKCTKIAENEGITQRQKYKKESKQLVWDTYNGKHPKRVKLERKMTEEQKNRYQNDLNLYKRAVN